MAKAPKVTLAEVEAYGLKWIPRLHLLDWQIEFRMKRRELGVAGTCWAEFRRRAAQIWIDPDLHNVVGLDVSYIKIGARRNRLVESVVVHELLHILEKPLETQMSSILWKTGKPEPDSWVLFQDYSEMMIDSFVRILLEADAAGAWSTPSP